MSIDAITAVLEDPRLVGTAKLVLVSLAWHANGEGLAWPSQATMARHAGITVRQVRTHLLQAAAVGMIVDTGAVRRSVVWRFVALESGSPLPHSAQRKRKPTSAFQPPIAEVQRPVAEVQRTESGSPLPPNRKEPSKEPSGKKFACGKKEAGDGPNASAPTPTVERLFETLRAEIGEHAFKTWLAPLEVAGEANGSLTFRAPTRCHRDYVAGRFGSRLETLAGRPIEVLPVGDAGKRPPGERPPPPPPPEDQRPDLSQLLRAMPPGDLDNGTANPRQQPPPPARPASTRRKVSGFSRQEFESGALDLHWPAQPPPDKLPPAPNDPGTPVDK